MTNEINLQEGELELRPKTEVILVHSDNGDRKENKQTCTIHPRTDGSEMKLNDRKCRKTLFVCIKS